EMMHHSGLVFKARGAEGTEEEEEEEKKVNRVNGGAERRGRLDVPDLPAARKRRKKLFDVALNVITKGAPVREPLPAERPLALKILRRQARVVHRHLRTQTLTQHGVDLWYHHTTVFDRMRRHGERRGGSGPGRCCRCRFTSAREEC